MAAWRPDGEALIAGRWPDLRRPGGGVALCCELKKENASPQGRKRSDGGGREKGMTETLSDSREVTRMVYLVISSCLLSSRCLFFPTALPPHLSVSLSLSPTPWRWRRRGDGGQMLRTKAGDPDILPFAGQRKF